MLEWILLWGEREGEREREKKREKIKDSRERENGKRWQWSWLSSIQCLTFYTHVMVPNQFIYGSAASTNQLSK